MRALIDGDVILYAVGFAAQRQYYLVAGEHELGTMTEVKKYLLEHGDAEVEKILVPDPVENALHSAKAMIERIQNESGCDSRTVYLTGKGNYRDYLYPLYKANRAGTARPVHYQAIKDYMIKYQRAVVVDGQEADDQLGIDQGDETVICTIDKDLDMISGLHYNWLKPEKGIYYVTAEEGLRWFYRQLLMGDATDNIPGIKGIGMKKSEKLVEGVEDYDNLVYQQYAASLPECSREAIITMIERNANLLLIRTTKDQPLWKLNTTAGLD